MATITDGVEAHWKSRVRLVWSKKSPYRLLPVWARASCRRLDLVEWRKTTNGMEGLEGLSEPPS